MSDHGRIRPSDERTKRACRKSRDRSITRVSSCARKMAIALSRTHSRLASSSSSCGRAPHRRRIAPASTANRARIFLTGRCYRSGGAATNRRRQDSSWGVHGKISVILADAPGGAGFTQDGAVLPATIEGGIIVAVGLHRAGRRYPLALSICLLSMSGELKDDRRMEARVEPGTNPGGVEFQGMTQATPGADHPSVAA